MPTPRPTIEALEARLNALGVPHQRVTHPHYGTGVAVTGAAVYVFGPWFTVHRAVPPRSYYLRTLDDVMRELFLRRRT